ncbi:MAG: hypothetical protein A2X12_09095 [Bacteroidetes bacterium GWE2_29_8]|nr:MAG: hypothetical protein A2X12_09095 [Bacteroidetes bacterium GWE2_29_8]OFY17147.1 MAG: hypothetical protein A2X02_09300 [Bacteroidetes bacterium GWF2_29_10]
MRRIIISRTDSIGDVILTLPLATFLKKFYNGDCYIIFLGRLYTKEIINLSNDIDEFADYAEIDKMNMSDAVAKFNSFNADTIIHVFPVIKIAKLAKFAQIKERIGTSNRIYHWLYCNKLSFFSRKKSNLHEAQLNFKLLCPLKIATNFSLNKIRSLYNLDFEALHNEELLKLKDNNKFNLIIHPKSKGSAREWGIQNYKKLIELLPPENFKIFITGTEEEGKLCEELFAFEHVSNLTGQLSLKELISFINIADGIVACSTGPLHIGAIFNKIAIGIYPPIKPMHPQRWAPLGNNVKVFVKEKDCNKCKNKNEKCLCIEEIKPEAICEYLKTIIIRDK